MTEEEAGSQIRRLSGKKDWPFEDEGKLELIRVTLRYGQTVELVSRAITWVCENLDHCPDSRELIAAFRADPQYKKLAKQERFMKPDCPNCHGTGWKIVEGSESTGALRCECGSIPAPPSESVPLIGDEFPTDPGAVEALQEVLAAVETEPKSITVNSVPQLITPEEVEAARRRELARRAEAPGV